jgi:hypothetical protein
MKAREIIWTGLLAAAVALGGGCGKGDKSQTDGGKRLSAKEKKEKLETIKKDLERLKVEMAELQREAKATEMELEKARGQENE